MNKTKINKNVSKIDFENGETKFFKKVNYDMNIFYTKLAENIYEQVGAKYVKNSVVIENNNRYLVTEDIQKDKELILGDEISKNTDLSLIKEDLNSFLLNKEISQNNINEVWDDFLKIILADIYTANPDRHGKNWGVLIKDKVAQIAPNFDYDYTFSQNEYAMIGIAEAIENKDDKLANKVMKNYNVKKFTKYLKYTTDHIGLHIGVGRCFLADMETKKYTFKETSKYIQKELGQKEYKELVNKVDIQKALPVKTKENEIYSLLAKMHSISINEKITKPDITEQER